MCPDLSKHKEKMYLQGDEASMVSQSMNFKVDRCTQSRKKDGEKPCASEEEIDEYLYDLQVDTWIL